MGVKTLAVEVQYHICTMLQNLHSEGKRKIFC